MTKLDKLIQLHKQVSLSESANAIVVREALLYLLQLEITKHQENKNG